MYDEYLPENTPKHAPPRPWLSWVENEFFCTTFNFCMIIAINFVDDSSVDFKIHVEHLSGIF
jgi:hypothetical protein